MKKVKKIKNYQREMVVFKNDYPDEAHFEYWLERENASLELFINILGKGKKRMKIFVNVIHKTPNTKSRVIIRNALFGRFAEECFANIKIEKNCRGADAFLEIKSLMFSEEAMVTFRPIMEIKNHEVKASHAAAVGRVSEKDFFYLQSRGFSKKESENICLKEFFMCDAV